MGLFDKKKVGFFSDVIRCDEPSYLIWKWHPVGTQVGEHKRENEIRWGSSLRVKEGEVAVFVYKKKDGSVQDFIEGPFDETLKTNNFPIWSSIMGGVFGGVSPIQAEVYFINLARIIQIKFGVPFFDVYDPRFPDFSVPVAVRGTISFKIDNYREFIKLRRLHNFDLDTFQMQIRDAVRRYVKDVVANVPQQYNIPVIQIETKTATINEGVDDFIKTRLKEDFGVVVVGIDIGAIDVDKSSEGYRQLMSITKDVATATIQARTAADIENYEETLRIQREEGQYAQRMHTRSSNLGAYQMEKQAEVGIAGAEALGQMGVNGAGNVDLGGNMGFNPAAMMASIALGGVVGQNVAATMGGVMQGMGDRITPPPIPVSVYHVALNGKAEGPFDLKILQQMATLGSFQPNTFVWKTGMSDWVRADSIEELKDLFNNGMPPIPVL